MECCARRQVLTASGVIAAGAVLGGCGSDAEEVAQSATDAASSVGGEGSEAVAQVASAADVPVGGGTIVQSAQVVLTQPTEGDFKAFSAVCPHQGCIVSSVETDGIVCACHGSRFDLATGAVLGGPATSGLTEKAVTVSGDGISVS